MIDLQYADSMPAKQKTEACEAGEAVRGVERRQKGLGTNHANLMMGGGDYIRPTCYGAPKKLAVAGAMAYECYNYDPGAPRHDIPDHRAVQEVHAEHNKRWYRDANGRQVQGEKLKFEPVFGDADHPPTYVHYLVVVIKADNEARTEQLFKILDFGKLGKLMG